jgi:mono/diheme cytochrome c family protein
MQIAVKVVMGAVLGLAVVAVGAVAFAHFGSEAKLHRKIDVQVAPVAIPTDQAALERGAYLYKSRGCAECHGENGAGKIVIEDDGFLVRAPQVTPGAGSVTASYTPEDWVRAVRHGVKPNGEPAFIMPSEDFNRLTDADLGAIVAYIESLPVVPGTRAELQVPLIVRLLYAAGYVKDSAEKIDHSLPPAQPPAAGDVIAQGGYVAEGCKGCHNASLSGGAIPGAPPDWPPAANLTSGSDGVLARYPDAESFAAMFRTGKRPDGTPVSTVMPFQTLREMSDADIRALYAHLKTLPPRALGELQTRS